jgi:hypothetical protein
MANEIYAKYESGFNLDAYVFQKTTDQVFDVADGGDTFEVWSDGNVLNYDIPMTDQGGGFYTVDFPSVITTEGIYRVIIKLRDGVNAVVGDFGIFQGEISWDGENEDTQLSLSDQMDVLLGTSSRVLNKYPTEVQADA